MTAPSRPPTLRTVTVGAVTLGAGAVAVVMTCVPFGCGTLGEAPGPYGRPYAGGRVVLSGN
ncbi:hypothetical protein GCM10010305_40890 [Streptomyces termitum]|uniref:Uncharacterized protein n=1 Tax=Streptomyces termitum TaxID=67368 RepID=A0A918WB85_9ACTN|nr:hypothetical protein GCM10010305_40890 [Streptomyces termitum]